MMTRKAKSFENYHFLLFSALRRKNLFNLRISKNETGDGRTEVLSPFLINKKSEFSSNENKTQKQQGGENMWQFTT